MRWFTDGENDGSLRNLGIRSLVPIDLNSILCEYKQLFFHRLFSSLLKTRIISFWQNCTNL